MKFLKAILLSASLCLAATSHAAISVTEPGDGFSINTVTTNGSPYTIQSLTFDFSGTTTADGGHLVIDGSPVSFVAPAGGTVSFFGGGSIFGFNFTGFGAGETFSFSWDPDSTLSGSYGATGLDFLGGIVTAVTSGGQFSGVFLPVANSSDVTATLAEVPEPGTYALLGVALMAVALSRRRASTV